MRKTDIKLSVVAVLLLGGAMATGPAFAQRHDQTEQHNQMERRQPAQEHETTQRHQQTQQRAPAARAQQTQHFADQHRTAVRAYYAQHYKRHCPPGLEKMANGCAPRVEARRWERGRPLPRDVVFYDLPPKLAVQIGAPPRGDRYVRVAGDILLIAVGTGMVIDAINNLGR